MSRRKAREIVLCLVFEKEYHKDCDCKKLYGDMFEHGYIDEIYKSFKDTENKDGAGENYIDEKYIKGTFVKIFDNIEQIDAIISSSTIGWEYNRISRISIALLRIAVYEILYAEDIPDSVAINEVVELSKKYDTAEAYTFINGILGTVVKNHKK